MADANAVSLQSAINRFTSVAGFNAISPDGVVGNQTLLATRRVLDYLSVNMDDGLPEAVSDQAANLNAKTTTTTGVLAMNAAPLAGFLNHAANLLKLPAGAAPRTPSALVYQAAGAINTALPLNPLAPSASITDTWQRLPTWQKLLVGALFGFGALWAHQEYKARSVRA
jgi:hypothetical protein